MENNLTENSPPAVFVHGMFGFGPKELRGFKYWGHAFEVPSPIKRFESSVGPLSSVHDRACELAAQIKGDIVDYGETHAAANGHNQHGIDFTNKGLVPDWDENHPIHFIGHSLGAQTIRCLQNLLDIDFWGWGSNNRWVCSLTSLSGSLNGSPAPYLYGVNEQSGLISKREGISPLLRFLEIYTFFTGGLLENIYDFDLEHWGYKRESGEDLIAYLTRVSESRFLWEADNAFYSASLQGAYRDNGHWQTFPSTYYFSFITEQTFSLWSNGHHYPSPLINPALFRTSQYIGSKRFVKPPIPVSSFQSKDWWENDGLVSTFSQQFPRSNGLHPVGGEFMPSTPSDHFKKGKWYYSWVREKDHGSICIAPRWWQQNWQENFYTSLLSHLAGLSLS